MVAGKELGRVLVLGAGIGGLAAATAFAKRDVEVQVLEVRPEFAAYGVGLGQPANGLRALAALGVLDQCLDAGYVFDRLRLFDHDRRPIVDHHFLLGGDDVPPFAALPRADLHRILFTAAEKAGVSIRMGATVDSFEDTGDGVAVRRSDGESEVYDLVVAFEGIRSTTRRALFGDSHEPTYTGYAAWRLMVPRPPEVTSMEFYQGIGSKTGVMPLTDELMYLFHIRPEPGNPWQDRERFAESMRERLHGYGGVAGAVRDSLSQTDDIVYSPLETVLVPLPWHRGRVVLGGDAMHASPPHLTQGAAMAMEDALVLVEETTSGKPVDQALESYGRRRFDRCRYVQQFSMDMLEREQAITTPEQLETARRELSETLSERLASSDLEMNQQVFTFSAGGTT